MQKNIVLVFTLFVTSGFVYAMEQTNRSHVDHSANDVMYATNFLQSLKQNRIRRKDLSDEEMGNVYLAIRMLPDNDKKHSLIPRWMTAAGVNPDTVDA